MWRSTWEFNEDELRIIIEALKHYSPMDYDDNKRAEQMVKGMVESLDAIFFYKLIHGDEEPNEGEGLPI